MQGKPECNGRVEVGLLPEGVVARLAQFPGNWLEFAPEESAIVVRHVQPGGCPAISAVPCELISMIDCIPGEQRQAMPGGELFVKDAAGQTLRLLVEQGDVRIQWPCPDYAKAVAVPAATLIEGLNPRAARVNGWARFRGAPGSTDSLQAFVDAFEGLYPEGDMLMCPGTDGIEVALTNVNVGPGELMTRLQELADPLESLEAELDVSSFAADATDENFRILIRHGRAQALRPSLWR
jgi:hypothetical protein